MGRIPSRKPIDVQRSAWLLIRKYGDDGLNVAYLRSRYCQERDAPLAAAEWRLVARKVMEFHFAGPHGPHH